MESYFNNKLEQFLQNYVYWKAFDKLLQAKKKQQFKVWFKMGLIETYLPTDINKEVAAKDYNQTQLN